MCFITSSLFLFWVSTGTSVSQTLICYFTAMALLEVSLGSSHFCQVGHRVIEELPKATKNVGMLCSWADKDKQEKAPESTLKMLWNSPFKLTRAMPEPPRTWLHSKASPEKQGFCRPYSKAHRPTWECKSNKQAPKHAEVIRNVWIQPAAISAPAICLSPNTQCGYWGQYATAHTRN